MQLQLQFHQQGPAAGEVLTVGTRTVLLRFVRNPRARRYILRVTPDGTARVTIPRGGAKTFAMDFARRHGAWVEKQLQKHASQRPQKEVWTHGTNILFRGELVPLRLDPGQKRIQFADQEIALLELDSDLRPDVERHLKRLAVSELTDRTLELANLHGISIRRVAVRSQRSRWGSCSVRRTVSLNWRLIHVPPSVRDYIILHELMHLKEMNHSALFWQWVEQVCPDYRAAEKWLNRHDHLIRLNRGL